MKKLIFGFLCLIFCVALAACGKGGTPQPAPLADGMYSADFNTDSTMFHVNEANNGKGILTVKDGQMTIHVALPSKSIVNLFAGTAADAQKDGAALLAAAKTAAKEELAAYKNADDYRDAQKTELAEAIAAGEAAIDAATNSDAVATALAAAKTAIDAIKTDAELTAEEEAAAAAADQAAADAVEAKIAAIGSVEYTDACKAKIDDVQAAFDALTDTQKALVENKDVLDAAAKKYAELKAEAEKPTEPIEPTDGDVCPICGKTEHDNHRDQVLHAVFVFVHDLVISVLIPLIKYLSK